MKNKSLRYVLISTLIWIFFVVFMATYGSELAGRAVGFYLNWLKDKLY